MILIPGINYQVCRDCLCDGTGIRTSYVRTSVFFFFFFLPYYLRPRPFFFLPFNINIRFSPFLLLTAIFVFSFCRSLFVHHIGFVFLFACLLSLMTDYVVLSPCYTPPRAASEPVSMRTPLACGLVTAKKCTCLMYPCRDLCERGFLPLCQILVFCVFRIFGSWGMHITGVKNENGEALGRGTLNTCAKFQRLPHENGVDIWTFVR